MPQPDDRTREPTLEDEPVAESRSVAESAASENDEGLGEAVETAKSAEDLDRIFDSGDRAEQAEAVSRLLSYAPWDEIWSRVDRERVRDLFPDLDLPGNLRDAWARYLGLDPQDHDPQDLDQK